MRFYQHPGFPTSHHCILVFFALIVVVSLAAFQDHQFIAFPTRWELPDRFEHVNVSSPNAMTSLTRAKLKIHTSIPDPYGTVSIVGVNDCYALLDDNTAQPTVVPVTPTLTKLHEIELVLESDVALTTVDIRWICDHFQMSYSSEEPPPTMHMDLSILIDLYIDNELQTGYSVIHNIEFTPTMIHDYSWSNQLDSINVKFTFFCPTIFLENGSTTLTLDHPLLDIASITSMHSSPHVNAWDDYVKPYHLFDTSVVLTYAEIACGDHFFHVTQDNDNIYYQFTRGPIPQQPQQHITCSFDIQYPPDYIGYMLTKRTTGKIINTHTFNEWQFDMKQPDLILGHHVPDPMQSLPPAIAVWAIPHHNRATFPIFEFGIAERPYLYSQQGKLKLQSAPLAVRFEVHVHGRGGPRFQYTAEWRPRLDCKSHDAQSFQFDFTSNIIPLRTRAYNKFGLTCQITLTPPPSILAYDQASLSIFFFNHDTEAQLDVLLYNPYHAPSTTRVFPLYNMNHIDHIKLPPIQPMEWNAISEGGARFIVATCHLQYLLDRPMDLDHKTTLTFVFPDYLSIDDILLPIVNTHGLITIASRGYTWQTNAVSVSRSHGNFHEFLDEDEVVPVDLVFQNGRPIRSPSLQVVLDQIKYEVTQPLSITIMLPIKSDADVDRLRIFPVLGIAGQPEAYTPQLALITPISLTPLTGYSYRCVTWDRMMAPYVYDLLSSPPVTEDNSFACAVSISPQTGKVDVSDASLWRRREFMDDERMLSGRICFYELAAVCVTPSTTHAQDGTYVVHPLADCPSFLGETHAVPCNLAFRDDENNHDGDNHEPQIFDYFITNPIAGAFIDVSTQRQILRVGWWYAGDLRLTVTISVRVSDHFDVTKDTLTAWIPLENTPMAYLNPLYREASSGQAQLLPDVTFRLPLFNSIPQHLHYRISLNDSIREVKQAGLIKNPYSITPIDGCTSSAHKMIDPITHLCVCEPGYTSNVPTGLNNPYIFPVDFTCISRCDEGYRWNTRSSQCEPMIPVQFACHIIPDNVEPPFYTDKCGYGVATDAKCQACTCFSTWERNPQDKQLCTHCRLKDTCIPANTFEITFEPKYCLVGRCLCKPGYYGDQCQHQVMYGTLEYRDTATDEQKANPALINATKKAPMILPRRMVASLQPRIINNVKISLAGTSVDASLQQVTQVLSAGYQDVITSIVIAMRYASSSETLDQHGDSKTIHNTHNIDNLFHPTDVSPFNDLYGAWEQLQESYHNHPVSNDEEYGALDDVKNAYDPHCVENGYTYCPDGEDNLLPPESQVDEDEIHSIYEEPKDDTTSNTTLYIIIGVVVGVVVLLFVLLIASIIYCRNHQRACFRQKNKQKHRDTKSKGKSNRNTIEISYKPSSGKSSNLSSPPPSSTASTSSYLPTQTQVADPTLPADWIALEDKNTGKIYFSNKTTMESSWDHPAKPKQSGNNKYGW